MVEYQSCVNALILFQKLGMKTHKSFEKKVNSRIIEIFMKRSNFKQE